MSNQLKRYGYNSPLSKDFELFVVEKHHSRFKPLIEWLTTNKLSVSEFNMRLLYKIDVVSRRMLSEILKPVELLIQSKLMNIIEEKNWSIQNIAAGAYYEQLNAINKKIISKKISTWSWINNAIFSISRKLSSDERNNLSTIISKFSFGQLSGMISLLEPGVIKEIYNFSGSKKEFCDILDKIVSLRNYIAHHSMIFNISDLPVGRRHFPVSDLIESLSMITYGNYREELTSRLKSFRDNTNKKYYEDNEEAQKNVNDIFEFVIKHLICV